MNEKIQKLFIKEDISVKQAMKQMDEAAEKVLFIVNDDMELLGSLTDGDIRRWILADRSLKEKVDKVFNKDPLVVREGNPIEDVKKIMLEHKIEWVSVVDDKGKIKDVHLWKDIFGGSQEREKPKIDVPVVMMAGGKGTRLDPFTRILPKPLVPIGEKPVAEIIMNNFHECGCNDFHLILGYKGEMIKSYFDNTSLPYAINYVREKDSLGTAGGLQLLSSDMPETFFVSNCDIIIKADYRDIYDFHLRNKCKITLVSSMNHFKIPYGVIEINDGGELKNLVEKPEYDLLVNTGMYVIQKEVLSLIPKDEVLHFTDLMKLVKEEGMGKVGVYPVSEKSWLDVGQWEEYRETIRKIGT
ncbi:MAG: nucleotidyltransferase family protein [Candidatus Omnitrophota bacterium]